MQSRDEHLAFQVGLAEPDGVDSLESRGAGRPVVARLMAEHTAAPFPARLRGEEVAGVDAVMLDADIAGLVDTWLGGRERLSGQQERLLRTLREDVEAVVASLSEPDEVAYFRRLRDMARAVSPRSR